jgi:pimeloyl-[acyl-carrier protein] methyl ester esterase
VETACDCLERRALLHPQMTRIWLLPGMDGTGKLHGDLMAELAGHDVRVVAYEGGSYEEAYASLPEALKHPAPDDVIAAESFGGPLGIRIAAAHPVAKLVLVASFVKIVKMPLWVPPGDLVTVIHPPPSLAIRALMLGLDAPEALVARVHEVIGTVPRAWLAARLDAVGAMDASDAFSAIRSPIVWLRAKGDRMIPEAATEHARSLRSALEVHVIDGPHLLAQREPAAVARFLR